jgi:outer membrane protein TolC
MSNKLLYILIFFCLCTVFPLQAQESDISNMTSEDYIRLKLPPLDSLFENAKKGPAFQILDVQKQNEISLLRKEKRNWLKFFTIGGSYNYGILGNLSSFSDSATPLYSQYSENAQTSYHIGASVGFSFEDLFDIKPRVNRQKLKVKEIDLQKEKILTEVKQQIITLYTSILSSINLLKIKAENVTFANAQFKIGESNFLNGKGDITSLNTMKSMQSQALSEYESTRSDINRNLLLLEILSDTPIISEKKQ